MQLNGRENALFSEAMCVISNFYKQDKVLLNVYSGEMSTRRRGFLKVPFPAYGTTTLRSFKLTIFDSRMTFGRRLEGVEAYFSLPSTPKSIA